MKKTILILIAMILCISCSVSHAERKTVVKDKYYLGAMRVMYCDDYVSLRELPDKTSRVLARVPLDAIVLYCSNNIKRYAPGKYRQQYPLFIRCEYEGQEGYILKKYLRRAPEYEPAETKVSNELTTRTELLGSETDTRETVLNWQENNLSVMATYESKAGWENLRIGCFVDEEPIWGYTESVKGLGPSRSLQVYMGGTEDEQQVYVYDAGYGLTVLDLMDGMDIWTLEKGNCPLGDAAVFANDEMTGTVYIAGTDGPDPVAISSAGFILWRSETDNPDVYGPKEIRLNPNDIEVTYESGKVVTFDYTGETIRVSDGI